MIIGGIIGLSHNPPPVQEMPAWGATISQEPTDNPTLALSLTPTSENTPHTPPQPQPPMVLVRELQTPTPSTTIKKTPESQQSIQDTGKQPPLLSPTSPSSSTGKPERLEKPTPSSSVTITTSKKPSVESPRNSETSSGTSANSPPNSTSASETLPPTTSESSSIESSVVYSKVVETIDSAPSPAVETLP